MKKKYLKKILFLSLLISIKNIFAMESLTERCFSIVDCQASNLAQEVINSWPNVEGIEHFLTYPVEWQDIFIKHLKTFAEERWPVQTGVVFLKIQSIENSLGCVEFVRITPDKKVMIIAFKDKIIKIFLLGSDQKYHLHQTLRGNRGWRSSLVLTSDKKMILYAIGETVNIWILGDDGFYKFYPSIEQSCCSIDTIDISLDKSLIIFGTRISNWDQYIKIYTRGEDGVFSLFQEIQEKGLGEQCIVISGDKKTFACAYRHGVVKIFRLQEDGKYLEIQKFQEDMANIRDIAISEDGEFIAYGGGPDIPIKVLNLGEDGKYFLRQELKNDSNNGWFDCIYMSPDKKMIVAGFNNGLIEVWNLEKDNYFLQDHNILQDHKIYIINICGGLNNKIIVSSDNKGTILIWERFSRLDSLDLPQTLEFLQKNCF